MKYVLGILITVSLMGCSCPQKAVLRESMDGMTRTIRKTQLDWAEKLTTDPATGKDHREDIKALTPDQLEQFKAVHKEYDDLVKEDRARG